MQHDHDYGKDSELNSSPKRSRVTDWPLKNTIECSLNERASPPAARGKAALSRGGNLRDGKKKLTHRLSRFQEGSLNDKPSEQPPYAFLGMEDAMEQYHAHGETDEGKGDGMYDAGVDEARPTGPFALGRFGKAIANAFSGLWKEKQPPLLPAKDPSMDDRKVKAEAAYARLKMNDFKEIQPSLAHTHTGASTKKDTEDQLHRKSCQDSTMDIDQSHRSSLQTLRTQDPSELIKHPPNTESKRTASPTSELRSGRRSSSLHLRTPSFQNLKKVKSQIHLPSIVLSTEETPPLPTTHDQSGSKRNSQGLRRHSSRKDLAKHQRLSKKVSDLESKLDIARRELEKSLKEAPPVPDVPTYLGRKPFIPGALASLPSERLLTPQTSGTPGARISTEIYGSALVSSTSTILSSPSRQLVHELSKSVSSETVGNSTKKELLMSSDPITRPLIDGVDYAAWATAEAARSRRRTTGRSSDQQLSIDGKIAAGITKRQSSVSTVSKGPEDSQAYEEEATPPMPATSITVNHANKPRPATTFLGRPGSDTPIRTRSKNNKRGISPPPPSLSSASKKKTRFMFPGDGYDTALTSSSATGNRQRRGVARGSPAPKAAQKKVARAKAVRIEVATGKGIEKPLPEIQKRDENFEWDEDVF